MRALVHLKSAAFSLCEAPLDSAAVLQRDVGVVAGTNAATAGDRRRAVGDCALHQHGPCERPHSKPACVHDAGAPLEAVPWDFRGPTSALGPEVGIGHVGGKGFKHAGVPPAACG